MDHDILLDKLKHYGIRGIPYNLLKTYLKGRTQFTSVDSVNSQQTETIFGVPQGSVLGPLLFLIYINDLKQSITFSKVHHFADDTNILYCSKSLKDINRKINYDLARLVKWLRSNKISLNVSKTEIVLFRSPNKQITKKMNFRLSGQKIKISKSTKYLGVILDENLNFKQHLTNLKNKLNRENGILAKLRHFIQKDVLRTVYFAIFDSHLRYASQVWGLNNKTILSSLQNCQNKAIRIISFKNFREPFKPLYQDSKILNLDNVLFLNNCLLVYDFINKKLPDIFDSKFKLLRNQHAHNTRGSKQYLLDLPNSNTTFYGSNSILSKCVKNWNNVIRKFKFEVLPQRHRFISLLKNQLLEE